MEARISDESGYGISEAGTPAENMALAEVEMRWGSARDAAATTVIGRWDGLIVKHLAWQDAIFQASWMWFQSVFITSEVNLMRNLITKLLQMGCIDKKKHTVVIGG